MRTSMNDKDVMIRREITAFAKNRERAGGGGDMGGGREERKGMGNGDYCHGTFWEGGASWEGDGRRVWGKTGGDG